MLVLFAAILRLVCQNRLNLILAHTSKFFCYFRTMHRLSRHLRQDCLLCSLDSIRHFIIGAQSTFGLRCGLAYNRNLLKRKRVISDWSLAFTQLRDSISVHLTSILPMINVHHLHHCSLSGLLYQGSRQFIESLVFQLFSHLQEWFTAS